MEKIKKIWNSFKSGVVTWIFAYLAMYLVALKIGAMDEYNAQVEKLTNGINLFLQVLISGVAYVILEVYVIGFMNKIIESIDKDSVAKTARNLIISIITWVILGIVLRFANVEKIIGDAILTFMLLITILKGIIFMICQQINTYRYNKKLKEKMNEESL